MATTTPPAAPAPEKKSLFDTVVLSTPVMLTVIATFILGRSSSEMTQAQYQRAVASQNQSKVGDQWAFFQAKRIRGTSYETTAVVLAAQKAGPFTADTLVDSAQDLLREIRLAGNEDALKALDKKAASRLEKIKHTLDTTENLKAALAALDVYPEAGLEKDDADTAIDAAERKILDGILDDVRQFKPEKEVAPKTLRLKTETIDQALQNAKAKAAAVAKRGKDIDRVLATLDALVDEQTVLVQEYQRFLSGQLSARITANGAAADIAKLERRLDRARDVSARLLGDYKAARYAFDAHRYEDDARSYQDAAYLYEVQMLQSSARSDKHLSRSFGFMIAMLVAQVGVMIGSSAMMLKYRMPVWAIAALAGIIAIAFGVCVFLEVAPLM